MTPAPQPAVPPAQRLLSSLPLAVIVLAPGMRIASLNPAAEQFFGQSARRLMDRPLDQVLAIPDQRLLVTVNDTETPVSARDIAVKLPGQGSRRIDLTIVPVIDEPGWQVMTLHDNTASEALGEHLVADQTMMRGPEILAHEIKNPLAAIRGASQLLARRLGEADRSLTDMIAGEVDRVVTLINQMQTLSRQTAPPVEPCNLHEVVRRACSVILAAHDGGPASGLIVEEFDPSLPQVLGNSDSLVQVLINLLANAKEASSDTKKPRIFVRTRFASGLQLRTGNAGAPVRLPIELRVSDNGQGVQPDMRDHIFEPFVTSKKSGQGLGLALVHKLVRDMNGRITHERDDALGLTHFRIHLPMADSTAAHPSRRSLSQ